MAAASVPLLPGLARGAWARGAAADRIIVQPFDLSRVRLRPGPFLDAMRINQQYLLRENPDRLLHTFRITAGLPTSAEPLGGWEAPENELRGHFTGHYLSACAMGSVTLGDDALKQRAALMVGELAKCQQKNGYLSAFPEEFFDRLREGRGVWAPFYTLHKIMAGLLDVHTLTGNAQALDVLKGMAAWTGSWTQPLQESHMQRVLEREYGGMNEVLYNLAAVTGSRQYQAVAHKFDHERFFAPLALGRDELKGLHVNTNIPKVIGAARRYETMGDQRSRDIAEYFWNEVTSKRSYSTGGTSNGEGWNTEPGKLSTELGGYSQECCVTYNMLKLTRHVFGWTADPRAADYYERALYNGILGTMNPADGEKLYYVPMGSGYWKLWGPQPTTYWCCTGSGAESFSKFTDSIYFHDDDGLYVNLFIPSDLDWREKGLRVAQDTRFPEADSTTLTISADKPVKMPLRVRVPYWATQGGSVKVNDRALEAFAAPSSYFVLNRTWQNGDKVEITMPMSLHTHPMPDDPSLQSVMYGPIVLAARLGTEGLTPDVLRAAPTKPRQVPAYKGKGLPDPTIKAKGADASLAVKPAGTKPLEFQTTGQERELSLIPLYQVYDERYAVYFKVSKPDG
jgi:DUF1680 family protein